MMHACARRLFTSPFFAAAAPLVSLALAACSGDDTPSMASADAATDVAPPSGDAAPPDDAAASGADAGGDGGTVHTTFSYRPSWGGVTKVDVVGGFGQATDWSKTDAFLTLTDDGTGTFRGEADLPSGAYAYLFRVTGDDDAAQGDAGGGANVHYAVDPAQASVVPCPAASPTYAMDVMNPCSQVTVPGNGAATLHHLTGTATLAGAPAKGYLVVFEREEPTMHHFFVDRVTLDAKGHFDFAAASGHYRLQIQLPDYERVDDASRNPATTPSYRRAISTAYDLSTDLDVTVPDMAYGGYATFAPAGTATLPTAFAWPGGAPARLTVYGPGNRIGDPWYTSALVSNGTSTFDGTFDTKKAMTPKVVPGTRYFWGIEAPLAGDGGAGAWTGQSLVFPITWK